MTDAVDNGAQAEPEYAEAWRPETGDTITGVLLDVKMIDPGGNGAYPCVTLQTAGGEKAIHAFHTVLRNELARARPKNGDEITVTYLGQKDGGKNGSYHAYRVRGGQGQEFDWDSQLPPQERQQSQQPVDGVPIPPAPVPPVAGSTLTARSTLTAEQAALLRQAEQIKAQQETQTAAAQSFGEAPPF